MGNLFGSKTKTTSQPYEKNPWDPQQPFLKKGFEQASGALDKAMGQQPDDPVADTTGRQRQALDAMFSTGMGAQGIAGGITGSGSDLLGRTSTGLSSTLAGLHGMAGQDRTGQILDNAAQYADNPYLDGQIDASLGDVRQAFDRNVGDINSAAVGTGNINSTRAGALEARALDDAQDRAAMISSTMRGDAYSQGVDRAMDQSNRQYSERASLAGLEGNSLSQALGMLSSGYQYGQQGANDALRSGSFDQSQQQSEIDGRLGLSQRDLDLVNQYMSTIGGSFGGSGYTSQVNQSASPFQQIVGAGLTGMGLF